MYRFFSERNTPRWIIFSIDVTACIISLALSYLLRFNFSVPDYELPQARTALFAVLAVRIGSFLTVRTYQGIIRYTGSKDAYRIFFTILSGSVILAVANLIAWPLANTYLVPFSIIIIDFFITTLALIAFRLAVKAVYMELRNPGSGKRSVIIYGAGESGIITKRAIDRDARSRYKVVAFLDDDESKRGKTLEGVKIYATGQDMERLLSETKAERLIISIQNIQADRRRSIIEQCLAFGIEVQSVPPVRNWIDGRLSVNQIRNIRIEELLEREPIRLDTDLIKGGLEGKTILVTGGAGSIGSEIVRQLIPFAPRKVVALDQAESPLYELELQIREDFDWDGLETVIADVRQADRMRRVFEAFRPDVVFHAAAYKHVPVMENNPSEAILTNVHGTKTVADLAREFHVEKFILISTDKAVNPTNIMGATKRIAEIYCQSSGQHSSTRFITTRFGNVLDSNGSVIPRFRKQIEAGGPLTVTHPDITRYFMTIPEACQLVLEAGSIGKGGEIYLFDMGESVRILDLAQKMIRLAGLEEGRDIRIEFTGLRPGEKLHEELLADKETSLPTHHEKIMVAKIRSYPFESIDKDISELIDLFRLQQNESIVRKMKAIVPEYVSANSEYERLDTTTS